jgi:hypothetical protein
LQGSKLPALQRAPFEAAMSLEHRIQDALNELRTLMLGAQILLGFQLQAPFQNAFHDLPALSKRAELLALLLMTLVVGLLIAPGASLRIARSDQASESFNRFATRLSIAALLPLAAAIALDMAIALERIAGAAAGLAAGLCSAVCAVSLWYWPLLWARGDHDMPDSSHHTPVSTKIDYVLTESRIILPGAQAILGFQLVIVLTSAFSQLPPLAKGVHGLALAGVALATMLLIAPAACHRLAFNGQADPAFLPIARRLLLAATFVLALGLAADIFVVAEQITRDAAFATSAALVTALILLGLWHVWPLWRRSRRGGDHA